MTLVERLWAVVTSLVSVMSFSPILESPPTQVPLEVLPFFEPAPQAKYPSFTPPGADDFKCEYPLMKGWEDCSHELDRKCWLREIATGRQLDINTDYENIWPNGTTRRYTINIADGSWSADGLKFDQAKLFNNSYPGPWLQACWGDRLVVTVINSLKHNGTSVHWHGIRQLNTTQMDGVNGITQCPIAPKDHFVYNFTLHQYGSSWYHSHYSVQYADGALGPLTIHGPSSGDWDEAGSSPLILTDWFHNSAFGVLSGGFNGGKDILLNGRGDIRRFNNTAKNETEVLPLFNMTFESPRPGQGCKKYLLRIINASFDTTFVFSIDNYLLTVVSSDFVPIQPYRNTSILIGIGQRYNVIVEASPLNSSSPLAPDGNYWMRAQIAQCFRGSDEGSPGYEQIGILRYNESSKSDPSTKRWPKIALNCSDETYSSLHPILPWTVEPPSNGDLSTKPQPFGELFHVAFDGTTKGYPLAFFHMDVTGSTIPMRINYSDPIFLHLDPENPSPYENPMWRVQKENFKNNKWIYLVLTVTKGNTTAHPIHLHGHDFAILEQAEDKDWDPNNTNFKFNNPPRRDVVLLPTSGYVVIAFKADNPGPWLVHCHIAFHISYGLGMQIMEDQAGAFALWPNNSFAVNETQRVCQNWRTWYKNHTNWAPKPVDCPIGEPDDLCFQDDSGV